MVDDINKYFVEINFQQIPRNDNKAADSKEWQQSSICHGNTCFSPSDTRKSRALRILGGRFVLPYT